MPDYEEAPIKKTKTKKAPTVKVKLLEPTAKEDRDATIEYHKNEIKAFKMDIKRHKLLIKQAKNTYKLTTL